MLTTMCELREEMLVNRWFSTVTQAESGAENGEAAGSRDQKLKIMWLRPALHLETPVMEVVLPTSAERGSRSVKTSEL